MKVVKYSGDVVNFEEAKLRRSLLKSGANEFQVAQVLGEIESQLYEGISTKEIYTLAFELLKQESHAKAARYNLRAALELLGPAGFYFEKYISFLCRDEGYRTKINLNLNGKCVSHEVDLVIQKESEIKMVECKFHSNRDIISDVKIPMYILSRFNDLKEVKHVIFDKNDQLNACLIVTNNRFSDDAVQFATCSGIELLSWDLPIGNSLRNKIDKRHLYPITCLTTLSREEKQRLLEQDIILVKQLKGNNESLFFIGISEERSKNIQIEVSELCN
ncbi:MAG: restriction endonuclease [Flavobacterium sp.]|nr:restriction endonuclease [Flavobacterium sp.]